MNNSSFASDSDFDDVDLDVDPADWLDDQEEDQEDCVGDTLELLEDDVLETLRTGRVEEKGLLPYSSNTSFLVVVNDGRHTLPAVYKPQRGENPLWDFEWGTLCRRETAAYVISSALDWQLVPPTVLREGTHGLGSIQFYIDHDANAHYFTIQSDARFAKTLRQLTLFDFLINNADRKSGHCLIGAISACGPSTTASVSILNINCAPSSGSLAANRLNVLCYKI